MSSGVKMKIKLNESQIRSVIKNGTKKGVWMALDHLATVSKAQVPLDQGPLKNSCVVDVSDDGSQGTVSYDTPYAVVQHENTQFQHQRGRKAKYLEDPAFDGSVQHEMLELAKRGMAEEMGG